MRYFLPQLISKITLFTFCAKECQFKKLDKIDCGENYSRLDPHNSLTDYGHPYGETQQIYHRYDDLVTFDTLEPFFKPNFNVDFNTSTVLGISLTTNFGGGIEDQSYICVDKNSNSFNFSVKYSLEDQCNGSGIDNFDLTYWVVTPKIPSQTIVNYSVEDVNPL